MPDQPNPEGGTDNETVERMVSDADHLAGSAEERERIVQWARQNLNEQDRETLDQQLKDPRTSRRAFARIAEMKQQADRRGSNSYLANASREAGGYGSRQEAERGRRELSHSEHLAKLRRTDTNVLGRPPQPSRRRV